MTSSIKCPCCGTRMLAETHDELTVDRCPSCDALWFDAAELDRSLELSSGHPVHAETIIPDRGLSALSCPRCKPHLMDAVGWAGLVIERCSTCRGLLVDLFELKALERDGVPERAWSVEQTVAAACVDIGWGLMAMNALTTLILRLLR